MRNIIGQAVSGNDFFNRPSVIRKIKRSLENRSHIYLSAPRRVGKTSIMNHLKEVEWENHYFVYIITQSIDEGSNFYKELSKVVMESEVFRGMKKVSDKLSRAAHKIIQHINLSVEIPFLKLSTQQTEGINFQLEFERLLEELDLEDKKLIIMADEFTQTVENILNRTNKETAKKFLQTFREITHNQKISEKVQFLLTGSIGLQPIVKKLESTDLINMLHIIDVPPLNEEEAKDLLNKVLENYQVKISQEAVDYAVSQIDWLVPFHIQLLAQEIIDIYETENKTIDEKMTEKAFSQILHHRNNIYFSYYFERLKKNLETPDYKFANELLNKIAQNPAGTIDKAETYDLAVKNNVTETYKATLESLMYDGYIHQIENTEKYRFNSSILKLWWKKYVC